MSELIKRLSERRANVWEQAKAILDAAEAENRNLTAEEQTNFDKASADLDEVRAQIDRIAQAEQRNRDAEAAFAKIGAQTPQRPAGVDVADDFRKLARGEIRSLGVTAAELRDLTKGTAASGGATVPTDFYGQMWEHLIAEAQLINYCTLLTTEGGNPLELPTTTGRSSAALIAENSTITESDPTFAKRTLSSYKYAVAFQVPSELLEDTGVDLTGFLARQAGEAVGNDLGEDLMVGDASAKPSGLFQTSTLGVTGATSVAGVPTGDNLIDLYYSVIAKYRNKRSAAWVMKDSTVASVRKIKELTSGSNQYLWTPGLAGSPDTIMGKPVIADPFVAATATSAKSVAFGDLSAYWARVVGGIRFERSNEFAFGTDQVTFRCILRADGVLLDQTGAVKHFIGGAS